MRSKILHLLTGMFILVAFIQCKESFSPAGPTPDPDSDPNINLSETTLIIPGNNSEQETSTTFKWEEVEGAESYQIQLSGDKEFSSIIIDSVSASTEFKIRGLPYDSTIHWQVRPVVGQQQGPWSVAWQFKTMQKTQSSEPVSTELQSPGDGATDRSTNVELQWTAVASASAYKVQIATDENFTAIIADEEVESTSFQTTGLDYESSYYWRVEPIVSGEETEWSAVFDFETLSESEETSSVKLVSPSDDASDLSTSPTLEWEELSGIDEYRVQLATSSSFTSPAIDEATAQQSLEVSGLDNNQDYYWRVQAKGDDDPQNWSSVRSFDTRSATNDGDKDYDGPNSVEGDRQALMDLYQATNGSNWRNDSGWGNGNPSNNWHGVEVDAEGRVVRLDLYNNGLSGQLPEAIGNLTKLRYLNVKNNGLSGEIPSSIGDMASLEWLILSGRNYRIGGQPNDPKEPPQDVYAVPSSYHPGKHNSATNNFSGTIPSTVGKLSNLKRLEISGQPNLKGPIPPEIGNITGLEGLYLSYNGFTGSSIPTSLSNLTNLGHLFLANNGLTGEIPKGFSNLTKLTRLHLGTTSSSSPNNNLTGSLPDLSGLTKLQKLSVQQNNLTGEWPSYWNNGNFTDLTEILAGWNSFTGTLHDFDKIPILRQIELSGNNLSGSVDPLATINSSVKIISLGFNDFSGQFPQNWPSGYGQLRLLRLNGAQITGHIPCDFWNSVDASSKLKWIYLNDNELDSNATSCMEAVSSPILQTINVSGNNF